MNKYLVIGNPIDHSLSPTIHNYWIKKNNIKAIYDKERLNSDDLKNLIIKIKERNISGVNVTVPFKKEVIPYLDKLTSGAEVTQSVNTILLTNDSKIVGYNTDIGGFENAIKYTKYDIDLILKEYDKKTKTYPSLEKDLLDISKHFNKKSIKEIITSLKEENSLWCKQQLNILEKKSPTSMGVATRQLDISKSLTLKDCLSMEFRICQAMMDRHDFYEGVRANLVDKDRDPKWKPITVDLLEEKLIDDHFKNLEDKELF